MNTFILVNLFNFRKFTFCLISNYVLKKNPSVSCSYYGIDAPAQALQMEVPDLYANSIFVAGVIGHSLLG